MAIDLVNDVARVTIAAYYSDAQVEETNIHYRCSIAGGADTRSLLGAAVYGYFVGNYAAVMSVNSTLYGWKVSTINLVPPPNPVFLTDESIGIEAGNYVPTQARPILRLRTAQAGRKYRGRMFLFSPGVGYISLAGFPTVALNTVIDALGTALVANQVVGGSTWEAVIAHLVPAAPLATTTTPVTQGISSRLFGTIRKSGNTGKTNNTPW